MVDNRELADMIQKVRHLLGNEDINGDFTFPSQLREVPSITSNKTQGRLEDDYAELGTGS
jgi:hypothetical protein